jgi:pimeloyl-ACP methyl ester carboxylesterase
VEKVALRTKLLLAVGLACSWIGVSLAQPATSDPDIHRYEKPGVLADVGGGRKINVVCMGHGSPTIVLTAGLGNWSETWRKVQAPLAQRHRVCAWDRAGLGFSSPSAEPQDVLHTTHDMEAALKLARLAGPYVLVGHSLGGYESLLFADRHPNDVVGMVLVDPSIPDQQRILARGGEEVAALEHRFRGEQAATLRRCAAQARGGDLGLSTPDPDHCLALPSYFTPPLREAMLAARLKPAGYETMASEIESFDADSAEVVNRDRQYGHTPIIVLTADVGPSIPAELLPSAAAQSAAAHYRDVDWPHGHDELAALSTRGRNEVVKGSGHAIHLANPLLVVGRVEEVIRMGSQ